VVHRAAPGTKRCAKTDYQTLYHPRAFSGSCRPCNPCPGSLAFLELMLTVWCGCAQPLHAGTMSMGWRRVEWAAIPSRRVSSGAHEASPSPRQPRRLPPGFRTAPPGGSHRVSAQSAAQGCRRGGSESVSDIAATAQGELSDNILGAKAISTPAPCSAPLRTRRTRSKHRRRAPLFSPKPPAGAVQAHGSSAPRLFDPPLVCKGIGSARHAPPTGNAHGWRGFGVPPAKTSAPMPPRGC